MNLPTTFEEQEERLCEIRRQLIELNPTHILLLQELRDCQRKIEGLCKEKWRIERSRIKITVCRTGQSGKTSTAAKPLDMKKAVASLDRAQTEELLLTLMRMKREMEKEDEPELEEVEECETYELEPYDPEDEEDETNEG